MASSCPFHLYLHQGLAQLDWFVLTADEYVSQLPDEQGIIRSEIFPGLWLAVSALLSGDMTTVLLVLRQGLHSLHQAFVQQFAKEMGT